MRLQLTVIGVVQNDMVPLMVFALDERGAVWCWHPASGVRSASSGWFQWTRDDDFMPPLFVDVPDSSSPPPNLPPVDPMTSKRACERASSPRASAPEVRPSDSEA